MREGWKYIKFEDGLETVPKTTKISSSNFLISGTYPIISQEEAFINGYWNNAKDVLHINHPIVVFGDHTRILKYIDFDFVIGADGVKVLSPIKSILPKCLYYYLKWCKIPSLGYSRHYKLLKELSIPIPPIEEQQRIVTELDLLSSIIEKQKAQLKELDTLAQSIFYDMFGDPMSNEKGYREVLLETLCSVITKGTTPTTIGYEFINEGVNFIKVESFTKDEEIDIRKVAFISKECHNTMKRSALEYNDILMCIAGATVGRLGKVSENILPANTNQAFGIIRLKDKNESLNAYVYAYLHSPYIRNIVTELKKGVAQPNLTLSHLRNFKILLPDNLIQQQFADKIQSIESQKSAITKSIAETQKLFDYTMDKYFG